MQIQPKLLLFYYYTSIYLSSYFLPHEATIAGSVTSFLVVVLLLTLAGGVVAVVAGGMRRKKKGNEMEGPTDSKKRYQHERSSEEDYCYATTNKLAFTNPASATASVSVHMTDDYQCDVSTEEKGPITMNPEELYTVPNKVKKDIFRKDGQNGENKQIAASIDDLYAKPDMTKKKAQGRASLEYQQDSEDVKHAPIAYKKHREAKEKGDEEKNGVGLPRVRHAI